jgi:hypothetical protein
MVQMLLAKGAAYDQTDEWRCSMEQWASCRYTSSTGLLIAVLLRPGHYSAAAVMCEDELGHSLQPAGQRGAAMTTHT